MSEEQAADERPRVTLMRRLRLPLPVHIGLVFVPPLVDLAEWIPRIRLAEPARTVQNVVFFGIYTLLFLPLLPQVVSRQAMGRVLRYRGFWMMVVAFLLIAISSAALMIVIGITGQESGIAYVLLSVVLFGSFGLTILGVIVAMLEASGDTPEQRRWMGRRPRA